MNFLSCFIPYFEVLTQLQFQPGDFWCVLYNSSYDGSMQE